MIRPTPVRAFDRLDSSPYAFFSRLQTSVQHRFEQFAVATSTSAHKPTQHRDMMPCALASTFACHKMNTHNASQLTGKASVAAVLADPDRSDLIVTGLDDISLQVAMYLDGYSLGRMQLVSRAWRGFVVRHRDLLFGALLTRCFESAIASSTVFQSFLLTLRHEVETELAHCRGIEHTHCVLEEYCTRVEPVNHGFIAMFCDIVRFPDPRIARFVAMRRHQALNMVLTMTPDHVYAFRKQCLDAGPIAFVPVSNPHWPKFDLPPVTFPGFMGYAFDHVEMVKGYESLKDTVVKSILKELMLFDTAENAAAYGRSVNKPPFVAIMDDSVAEDTRYRLTYSTALREGMQHLPMKQRIHRLERRLDAIDASILQATI